MEAGEDTVVRMVEEEELTTSGDGAMPEFAAPRAVVPQPVPEGAPLDHPTLYFNRELSWLDFNWRVLNEALDPRTPLLERVRFVAITASNMDEFFRKRVGGLKRLLLADVSTPSPDGRDPRQQLDLTRKAVLPLYAALGDTWENKLRPLLRKEAGIHILGYNELTPEQDRQLKAYFLANIFPILTPLAVDPGHPFPFISNLSLSIAVVLRHPKRGTEHFARLKVPTTRGRFVPLDKPMHFVPLEQVIMYNLPELFRGMDIVCAHVFRITRNADLRRDEEEADDLTELIAEELRERKFAPVVRLEVERAMPGHIRQLLMRELSLCDEDVFESDGMVDLTDLFRLADMPLPQHKYEPWESVVPPRLLHEGEAKDRPNIFSVIRQADLLVHHPYESFRATTERFVAEAADDPQVLAIKQTLYRTSDESPIVEALIRAAEAGKQVAVLVEVKARFDEENNMEWGQMMEKSGAHVTYGLVGLKTHSKTTLVIREEEDGLRTYCHFGTGNYNSKTARFYTDLGFFTAQPELGYDAINLFHYLTGYAPEQHYQRLITAPREMRKAFVRMVQQEVKNQEQEGNGRIIAKMNALDDVGMIQELYRASQAGVEIDLIVRGHCRLRPGLKGFSENIRVRSIIGRFLEHSRIYFFGNGGEPRLFIGSADWQRRNLDDRVETIVEVDEPTLKGRLVRILDYALADKRSAWVLRPDGYYVQRQPESDDEKASFQEILMQKARQRRTEADAPWDIK